MKEKLFYCTCALALFFLSVPRVTSQSLEWLRRGGSPMSDYVETIQLDQDGNIYAGGFFFGAGRFDTLSTEEQGGVLIKLDRSGNMMWGRSIPEFDVYDIAIDSRNGVLYAVGYGFAKYDSLLIKYALDGERLWSQRLPETWANGNEWNAGSVTVDANGDVYVGGQLGKVPHISKFSANGEALWHRTFEPDSQIIFARSLTFDDHGNLYVATSGSRYSSQPIQLIKIDPSEGDILWQKHIASAGNVGRIAYDGRGHILMTGSFSGNLDFESDTTLLGVGWSGFLARFDTSGVGLDVVQMVGNFQADDMVIDQHGDILVISGATGAMAIQDHVFPPFTNEAVIFRFGEDLQLSHYLTLGTGTDGLGIATDNFGTYVIGNSGDRNPIGGLEVDEEETGDFFIAKVGANSTLNVEERESPLQHIGLSPNPAWSSARLEIPAGMQVDRILIHDIAGRLVRSIAEDLSGKTTVDLNLAGMSQGMYYVSVRSDEGTSYVVPLVKTSGD